MAQKQLEILNEPAENIRSCKLPTKGDIIKAIVFVKDTKKTSAKSAINIVSKQVSEVWRKTNIPIVSERSVVRNVANYYTRYDKLCRSDSKRNNEAKFRSFNVSFVHNIWKEFLKPI